MSVNLDILARDLAKWFVQRDADRGISEEMIQSTGGGTGWGWKFLENNPHSDLKRFGAAHIQMGGYIVAGEKRRKSTPGTIVIVTLQGKDIYKPFSLHDIYQECKKGQLTLPLGD